MAAGLGSQLKRKALGGTMKAKKVRKEFEQYLARNGHSLASLTPALGAEAMLSFYREVRAADCNIAEDGDMLLYQWGVYDWGKGPQFEVDITRQLIVGGAEDDDIRQMHLTFRFQPSTDLQSLGKGDHWCRSPDELQEFSAFLRAHPVFTAITDRRDGALELHYEQAG